MRATPTHVLRMRGAKEHQPTKHILLHNYGRATTPVYKQIMETKQQTMTPGLGTGPRHPEA